MAKKPAEERAGREPPVTNKWWVDLGGSEKVKVKRPPGPIGSQFFEAGRGFEQDHARERLTDDNVRLLSEADPPEGGWGYVRVSDATYPERELERVKKLMPLPPYARGVVVDCGSTVRLLVTGTPPGDRLLELTLGETPSFDCWVDHEWVREALFDDADKALRALQRLIREYLSPEAISHSQTITARA